MLLIFFAKINLGLVTTYLNELMRAEDDDILTCV